MDNKQSRNYLYNFFNKYVPIYNIQYGKLMLATNKYFTTSPQIVYIFIQCHTTSNILIVYISEDPLK